MANSTGVSNRESAQASFLIREFRQLLGLTQEQFAARMGVTLPTINRWENDRSKPSPLALLRIEAMLNEFVQSQNQSRNQAQSQALQTGAQDLLARYFPHTAHSVSPQPIRPQSIESTAFNKQHG